MAKPIKSIEQRPPLWAWLCKHDARCVWQKRIGDTQYECWRVGISVVIAALYPDNDGWDLFTLLPSNQIEDTLADAEARCSPTKEAG